MKTHLKNLTVITVAVAIGFPAACKKDRHHASLLVSYRVADRTLVNNEDGRPRAISTLPVLGDETVTLYDEALKYGQTTIRNAAGEDLLLTIAGNKDGGLNLEQTYAATNRQASGTIYYALEKK